MYKKEKNNLVFYEIPYGTNVESLVAEIGEVAEDIELTVSGGSYFVTGETVTALFSDESKTLIIKDKEGNVLDIEQTRYEARRVFAGMRFTMPDCDIVLSFGD